jgi:mono/diheme cytochrome c family protein
MKQTDSNNCRDRRLRRIRGGVGAPAFPLLVLVVGLAFNAGAAPDAEMLEQGRALYNGPASCAVCHLPDGKGQPGSVPPLAGSDWLKDNPDRTIAIVLRGFIGPVKVNNKRFYSAMPPQLLLDDEKLALIISYVNNAWGNSGAMITAARVAKARATLPQDLYTPYSILKAFPLPERLRKRNGPFKPDFDDAITDVKEPVVYRTFMPGASPAAFAVALPGNQFYCWDAGECRLRYVWAKGGFIRGNKVHWSSNGKPVAEFNGDPYYRARSSLLKPEDYPLLAKTDREIPFYDTSEADDFPIGIKGVDARPSYLGYRLIGGYPEFRYALGKHVIRETIMPSGDQLGIIRSFSVTPATPLTFSLTPTDHALISSSAGQIAKDGSLRLTVKQSGQFNITIIEKNPAPKPLAGGFE